MKKTVRYYHQDRIMNVFVTSLYADLLRLKKNGDVKSFNQKLFKVVPKLEIYIYKRLHIALAKHSNKTEEYMVEDFVNQLFKQVYNQIDEVDQAKEFNVWLFKKAEVLLIEEMIEEKFDFNFFDNIDNYSKEEWDKIEEKQSVDSNSKKLFFEDLDTISFYKQDYLFNNIYKDNSDQEIIKNLDKIKVYSHTEMVLNKLPVAMQKVFELFTEHDFNILEIAKIVNRPVKEVESFLEVTKDILRTSLSKRYKE